MQRSKFKSATSGHDRPINLPGRVNEGPSDVR